MTSLLLTLATMQAVAPIEIRADAAKPTISVSKSLYGVFFEEINQAGEGGLYGELLHNRGFEATDTASAPIGWRSEGQGQIRLDSTEKLNNARSHSLQLVASPGGDLTLVNEGFWGIPVTHSERYRLLLWTKSDGPLEVRLAGNGGTLAKGAIKASTEWTRSELVLQPSKNDRKARLELIARNGGRAWLGYSSLMPINTWKGHGLRPDLANKLSDMKPAFVRFPGGCYIEGEYLLLRWNWKDTLGSIESRKGMARTHWGYPASNGLGYHEYLQMCEDLGSEAMFVANVGMSHREVAPMDKMDTYLQDTLDAIEYAIGPVSSQWGGLRAKNGHPKPFNLRYVQIGNENGGAAYNERFKLFSEAIHAKYPQIQRIACLWGGRPTSAPYELIDEHYYNTPSWFWRNANRYDSYPRDNGPKVYVGEYAVTNGSGRGNLAGALSEAAFMTGMERNADIVKLASYAPLFENVNNRQWNPNAILFDASTSYGTPSYWVQTLFAQNRVDRIVQHSVKLPAPTPEPVGGGVGLMTWRTDAEFKDLQVEVDGRRLAHPIEFEEPSGNWTLTDGVIRQNIQQDNRRTKLAGLTTQGAQKVTMSLKARKLAGAEGFIILFETSPRRIIQWNLGGWENTVHAFQMNDGRIGRGVEGKIETGRWYDIRIEQTAESVKGYLDGKLVEEVKIEPVPNFAAVAGIDERANELVLKIVNGSSSRRTVHLELTGVPATRTAKFITLRGDSLTDENSLLEPRKIAPIHGTGGASDSITFGPYSFTIIRLRLNRATQLTRLVD